MEGKLGRRPSPDLYTCPTSIRVDRSALAWIEKPRELSVEPRDVEGTTLKTASAIDTNTAFVRVAGKLNGNMRRAYRLFETRARELAITGSISQAQIIRHPDSQVPVFGVQSGDPNPNSRVRAFFSRVGSTENPIFVLVAVCKAVDDGKILDALRNAGYSQAQRTGRS